MRLRAAELSPSASLRYSPSLSLPQLPQGNTPSPPITAECKAETLAAPSHSPTAHSVIIINLHHYNAPSHIPTLSTLSLSHTHIF
ncbi:hypothetical protein T492DRAFT_1080645 [Pavlovales sp. CCMP2436]|nr:hypothetical protein T492DRAFT_1080645 [Pavlovales sp. CCMP2436]